MRTTLDPKNDVVFKILFAAPERQDVLIDLLMAVLRPISPIREAKVLNPEIPKALPNDRGAGLDILVLLDDSRQVDVEMQLQVRNGATERFLYYWAKMYASQLEPSDPFTDLKPCVSVLFLGQNLLQAERFHSTFRVREIHDQHDLTDRLELHVVELPKLALATSGEELAPWGHFFTDDTDEALEALAMTQPAIKKAVAALKEISADEKARQLARARDLAEDTYRIEMGAAYHSGKNEGRAEGRAEGVAEGLRVAARATAAAMGLTLDDARDALLDASDATQLRTLLDYLVRERKWPE